MNNKEAAFRFGFQIMARNYSTRTGMPAARSIDRWMDGPHGPSLIGILVIPVDGPIVYTRGRILTQHSSG